MCNSLFYVPLLVCKYFTDSVYNSALNLLSLYLSSVYTYLPSVYFSLNVYLLFVFLTYVCFRPYVLVHVYRLSPLTSQTLSIYFFSKNSVL